MEQSQREKMVTDLTFAIAAMMEEWCDMVLIPVVHKGHLDKIFFYGPYEAEVMAEGFEIFGVCAFDDMEEFEIELPSGRGDLTKAIIPIHGICVPFNRVNPMLKGIGVKH